MSEHTSDPNADYLNRHPDAEPDPDRANTAAYARKNIEDLIEIAKANGQNDVEGYLKKAADEKESTEVSVYDYIQEKIKDTTRQTTENLVKVADGQRVDAVKIESMDTTVDPERKFRNQENAEEILKGVLEKFSASIRPDLSGYTSKYMKAGFCAEDLLEFIKTRMYRGMGLQEVQEDFLQENYLSVDKEKDTRDRLQVYNTPYGVWLAVIDNYAGNTSQLPDWHSTEIHVMRTLHRNPSQNDYPE